MAAIREPTTKKECGTRIETKRNNYDPDKLSRPEISDSVISQFEYFQVFWDLFNMAEGF